MWKEPALRLEQLAQGVLGPLVLGGPLRLVPPIGPEAWVQCIHTEMRSVAS